eukprot:scaffold185073_cov17-Tisochrysis_lutea.AAC.1
MAPKHACDVSMSSSNASLSSSMVQISNDAASRHNEAEAAANDMVLQAGGRGTISSKYHVASDATCILGNMHCMDAHQICRMSTGLLAQQQAWHAQRAWSLKVECIVRSHQQVARLGICRKVRPVSMHELGCFAWSPSMSRLVKILQKGVL